MASLDIKEKKTIIQKIHSINPKGRTPITKSIELAVQQIKTVKDETLIVLLSDGIETCQGDPCAFVQNLKEKEVKFKLDVIGFAVDDKEQTQLECIAKAGDGHYYSAQSIVQMKQAFAQLKKEIIQRTAVKPGLKLRAILKKGAKPITEDINWFIYKSQTDSNDIRNVITSSNDASPFIMLPTGQYYITVLHGNASADTVVEISADEYKEITVNLNAGYLKLESVLKKGLGPLTEDMYWRVYNAQKDSDGNRKLVINSGNTAPLLKLTEGRYYITAEHGDALSNMEVKVSAGEQKKIIMNMNAGYLQLNAIPKKDAEPLTDDLYWQIYKAQKNSDGDRKYITSSSNVTPTFKLPTGSYYITAKYGAALASMEVKITAGEVEKATMDMNAGYLSFDAVLKKGIKPVTEDIHWQVYGAQKDSDGGRKAISNSNDASPFFKLSAGRYYVTAEHGAALASMEVTVAAGEIKKTIMDLNTGYLRFNAVPNSGAGPLKKGLYWRVYEAGKDNNGKRKKITTSDNAFPLFKLTSGRYYVTATHEKDQASVIVEVPAGDHKKATLNLSKIE
jgi:Ca-activated chloride channel family protein